MCSFLVPRKVCFTRKLINTFGHDIVQTSFTLLILLNKTLIEGKEERGKAVFGSLFRLAVTTAN